MKQINFPGMFLYVTIELVAVDWTAASLTKQFKDDAKSSLIANRNSKNLIE